MTTPLVLMCGVPLIVLLIVALLIQFGGKQKPISPGDKIFDELIAYGKADKAAWANAHPDTATARQQRRAEALKKAKVTK